MHARTLWLPPAGGWAASWASSTQRKPPSCRPPTTRGQVRRGGAGCTSRLHALLCVATGCRQLQLWPAPAPPRAAASPPTPRLCPPAEEELEEAEAKAGAKGAAAPPPASPRAAGGTPTHNNGGSGGAFQRCPTGAVIRTRTLQRKATGRHAPAPHSPRHHAGVDVLETVPSGRVLMAIASRRDRKVICLAGPLRMTSVLRCRDTPEFVTRARTLWAKRGLSFIIRAIYVALITTIAVFV